MDHLYGSVGTEIDNAPTPFNGLLVCRQFYPVDVGLSGYYYLSGSDVGPVNGRHHGPHAEVRTHRAPVIAWGLFFSCVDLFTRTP